MNVKWLQKLWMLVKLGATGAVIAGIAFAFGVFNTDLEVSSSDADIISFGRKEVTPTEKFIASMEDLGHSKPQAYNLNGNVVFFSTRLHGEESPLDVMKDYQKKFVEKGLAPRAFSLDDPDADEAMLSSMNGGIVPMYASEKHVFMGGMIPAVPTKTVEELEGLHAEFQRRGPWKMFKGFHNVDITKTETGTIATSSWSDENFNYAKMVPGNREMGQNVDPDVPACPGCVRLSSFEDLDKNQTFRNNVYSGGHSVDNLARHYDQTLTARGWQATDATRIMDKIKENVDFQGKEAVQRQYEKDGKYVTILAHPSDNGIGATAHTIVSD